MPNFNIGNLLGKLFTSLKIGGNMSEQGADKAGKDISFGIKFFFCCMGISSILAVILWLLPDLITAIH